MSTSSGLNKTDREKNSKVGNGRVSFLSRFRTDRDFRENIKRSAAVAWSLFIVGWLKGLIGPSFPEILFLTDTSLEKGSAYLTVLYTCKILGHALAGLVYDKVDRDVYTSVTSILNACLMIAFPWCRIFGTMIAMYGLHGLLISSMELGLITDSVNLWEGNTRQTFLQTVMFFFSISTIISPLALIPFLMKNPVAVTRSTNDESHFQALPNVTYETRYTRVTQLPSSSYSIITNSTLLNVNVSDMSNSFIMKQQSVVYLGFTIAAAFVISGGVPFACFYFSNKCFKQEMIDDETVNEELHLSNCDEKTNNNQPCKYKKELNVDDGVVEILYPGSREDDSSDITKSALTPQTQSVWRRPSVFLLLIVSCLFGAMHSALEVSMSDLMPMFCLQFLKWPSSQAAMTVSLLFVFCTLGRVVCAFLVKVLSLTKLLFVFVAFIILGSLGLSVSANVGSVPGTWVSIGVIGLGISACYPLQLGWTSQYLVVLTGKLTAFLLCTMYIGAVVAPPLLSFLMANYSYPFLCYGIITMGIITLICVIIMAIYVTNQSKTKY
ncbi:uncharacterized protein [Argopecten irradians]|uniref:uncharacterized protein n=1 Tax=Argopecten irradians TaxID=31199 RepID=UPI003712F372